MKRTDPAVPGALEAPPSGKFLGARTRRLFRTTQDEQSDALGDSSRPSPRFSMFGAPLDVSPSFRPGTALAPARIREASQSLEEYSRELDLDIRDVYLEDLGDLVLPVGDPIGSLKAVEETCQALAARRSIPIILGGEHLVTLPVVRAMRHVLGPPMAVIYFDAHADLRDEYLGVPHSHAAVARRLCDVVGAASLFQIGVRSGAREEWRFARDAGVLQLPLSGDCLDQIAERLKPGSPVHVSIDIDVLDPAFAPGVGCPEPGGPSVADLLQVVRQLDRFDLVSIDLVEVSPPYDPWGSTAFAAAKVLRDAILAAAKGLSRKGQAP